MDVRSEVQEHGRQAVELGRSVGHLGGFADAVHDVGTKSIHTAIQPEPQHIGHPLRGERMVPIDVRLLGEEQVEVVLAGRIVEGPRRLVAEGPSPVVGRAAVGSRVPPDVEAAMLGIP